MWAGQDPRTRLSARTRLAARIRLADWMMTTPEMTFVRQVARLKNQRLAFADMSILHYPVSTDPIACPYRECVPKGATVSSCCELLCRKCSGLFTEKCCGLDEGRAILKQCVNCGPCSDHWTPMCPLKDGVNKSSIPISMDLAPEKSKVAAAGHFMASYSPLYHCVTVQFSNDEHGGKDLWPPGSVPQWYALAFCFRVLLSKPQSHVKSILKTP
ncbi:hypothetical protein M0R45_015740 [Rubus argutus]|uniref:TNFR-Cys domain-containing protein n=1 Tax=Rubus argutus TaxID=59490 RepID=A0AAW1XQ51_RUBAR